MTHHIKYEITNLIHIFLDRFISSKFRNEQKTETVQGNIHSKVAILRFVLFLFFFGLQSFAIEINILSRPRPRSLRCQSLIHLKMYKMRRNEIIDCQKSIAEYTKKCSRAGGGGGGGGGGNEMVNGNTPSPTNSIGSQSSGSNTPASCQTVPLPVHNAFQRQAVFFTYLLSCHDMWEQADILVTKGNHTGETLNSFEVYHFLLIINQLRADFFIALDHENGPITLHSSIWSVVKYVQAGLQKLKLNQNFT